MFSHHGQIGGEGAKIPGNDPDAQLFRRTRIWNQRWTTVDQDFSLIFLNDTGEYLHE